MNQYCKFALLATTAMSFGLSAPAIAANADNTDEEIVVTARRMNEKLQDVPISIAVFNQQQLDDRNIVSAKDLATYTPSLATNPRFGSEATSFSIRGFVQDQFTPPSVAIYFADVVGARGASSLPVGEGAGPGSFFDLENTQVLKGPQGTLFGRNTTGGAILIVPKKPTNEFGGYVEGSFGNYGLQRYQGVLNTPLGPKARLRIGFDKESRDGYLNNVSGIGPKELNNINYIAGRVSLVVDVTPDIENYTIFSMARSDTTGWTGRETRCVPGLTVAGAPIGNMNCAQIAKDNATGDFYAVENSFPDPESNSRQWQVINTTTWHVTDKFLIKNIASYAQLKNFIRQDIYGTNWVIPPGAPTGVGQTTTFANTDNFPGLPESDQSTMTEELQFQGHGLNDRLTWQAGAYLELSDPLSNWVGTQSFNTLLCVNQSPLFCSTPYPALASSGVELRRTSFRDTGYYAQASYDLTRKLRVTAGLRFSDDRSAAEDRAITYKFTAVPSSGTPTCTGINQHLSNGCLASEVEHTKAPTGLIDFEYRPVQDVMIYTKYARGYREGMVNPRGLEPYKNFGAERVDSFELGGKTSWHGSMPGTFNFAGFFNRFSEQQILVSWRSGSLTNSSIVNTGSSRLWGVEADFVVNPFEGFRLDGSFTYLNTLLVAAQLPAAPAPFTAANSIQRTLPGWPFPFAPEYKTTVTGTYTLPLPDTLGRVQVSATFNYTDAYSVIEGPGVKIGSVALLNLNMNWNSIAGSPIDLSLFATNVTDTHYDAFLTEVTSSGIQSDFRGEPQMFGARVKYRFGSDAS